MARSKSISGSGLWKYLNHAYYLRRPRRLALLFIVFVSVSMVVWDRINLAREHEIYLACEAAWRILTFPTHFRINPFQDEFSGLRKNETGFVKLFTTGNLV